MVAMFRGWGWGRLYTLFMVEYMRVKFLAFFKMSFGREIWQSKC